MIQENSFLSTQPNPKAQVDSMGKALSNRSQTDDEFNNSVADWLKQFSDALSRIESNPESGKECPDGTVPNETAPDSHLPKQKKRTGPDPLELISLQTNWPLNAAPVTGISLIDRLTMTQEDLDTITTDGLPAMAHPVADLSDKLSAKTGRTQHASSLLADLVGESDSDDSLIQTTSPTMSQGFENSGNRQSLNQALQEGITSDNSHAEADGTTIKNADNLAENQNLFSLENLDDKTREMKPASDSDDVVLPGDVRIASNAANSAKSIPESRNPVSKPLELPVIRQIVDHASIKLIDGHSQIRIELKPESLGNLTLQISSENNQISLKITAENFQVKDAIENQIGQLRVELQRKGMEIDTVHVDIFNPESTYSQSGRQGHAETRQDKNGTSFASIIDENEPETPELSDTISPVPFFTRDRKVSCFV